MKHEPQINLLRMSGHVITEADGIYTVDGKFEILAPLNVIREKKNPTRMIGFRDGHLVERFKLFEKGKENLHSLVYIRNGRAFIELRDKPYAVCMVKMKELRRAGTHRLGVLKITQNIDENI